MSAILPRQRPCKEAVRRIESFPGLRRDRRAEGSRFEDTAGLSAAAFPAVTVREPRFGGAAVTAPRGMQGGEPLYYVDGDTL